MNPDLTQASLGASARDTCASINRRANCKLLKEGLLFIGDSLAYATDLEVDLLRSKHELATVIDTHPADDTQNISAINHPSGLCYYRASLMSPAYAKLITKRLSFWASCKVMMHILSMSLNSPAAKDLIKEVMQARGPIMESFDILDTAGEHMRELFTNILSDARAYPILICGQAMMRYHNLLVVLILLLLDVPLECIRDDYVATLDYLQSGPTASTSEKEFVTAIHLTKQQWAGALKQHLDMKYGGVDAYLASIGVTANKRDAVRVALRNSAEAKLVNL